MVELIKAVAEGRAGPDAANLLASLATRQKNILTVQVAIGIFVILTMAVARFS